MDSLLQAQLPLAFAPGKPGQPDFNPVTGKLTNIKPNLATFVSPRSWLLFSLIDANVRWLHDDPADWVRNPISL